MINFVLEGHTYAMDVQTAIQIFFPNRHYYNVDEMTKDGAAVKSILTDSRAEAYFYQDGNLKAQGFVNRKENADEKEIKHIVKEAVFKALYSFTGYMPKWGMITGVRPAKTASELSQSGYSDNKIIEYFENRFYVSHQKALLALNVSKAEREILLTNSPLDVSLYIGIPFCPTRCLYCSFTSYPIDKYSKKADEYINKLAEELKFVSGKLKGRRLRSVYIGGGTPTSLNDGQFAKLMENVSEIFDLQNVDEFTVEAGRPDTITKAKLEAMKKAGVNRISVNPQTMNQKTLDIIGRRHSVEDIKKAFYMAKEEGFNNINMDIILGLPQEKAEDVENTMREIQKLAPESLTVHTLAVKRASRLKENILSYDLTAAEEMESMINISSYYAGKMGLAPYYMYRQKAMLGNFENVGYCKKGMESIYNVEIMEEKQTIIATGAGGATKLYNPDKNQLVRVFNVKSVDDYLSRFDEMIERKEIALSSNKW